MWREVNFWLLIFVKNFFIFCFQTSSPSKLSSPYEKKNAVYYFQIPLSVPEIFKFLKYANWPSDDVIHSTKFWSNVMKKDTWVNLYQKHVIRSKTDVCSKPDSTKCAPQYELNRFAAMKTDKVPDFPDNKETVNRWKEKTTYWAPTTSRQTITISLPNFSDLCYKLAKIFIYLI